MRALRTSRSTLGLLYLLLTFLPVLTAFAKDTKYIVATDDAGDAIYLADDRKPALYTQNFGDCLGGSTINVTRFDAAYYKDNMTILFHLEGNTAVANESLMMYIGVYAYGEARFDLTFNPCSAQIYSLCPMNKSIPIEANGIIPVAQSDVSGIPPIALSIPDFEGQAILRIFSNSTQSEIGCYSAVVTNGATFSHPAAVGTALGIFTLISMGASFATAVYGNHVPTKRTHYAHSLSVFVVFSVLQHIFYTGALSMNWPSVLAAFWSNYAWAGGMIYSQPMQNSINQLNGGNRGNTSMVGAAGPGSASDGIGGGYQISQIYKRSLFNLHPRDFATVLKAARVPKSLAFEKALAKRAGAISDVADGYSWYGHPVKPGLPLPGNYSGFAGTLSAEDIPASNAFMTGFLWWLILAVLVAVVVVGFKWLLEGLSKANLLEKERLAYFRAHWLGYTALALLRTCFIAFFMMIFLTIFQFTFTATGGGTAVAAIIFLVFFVGMSLLAGYACYYRLRFGHYETRPNRLHLEKNKGGRVPFYGFGLDSKRSDKSEQKSSTASIPFLSVNYIDEDSQRTEVHQDEEYIKKFGWLASRFRRTRWWFFAVWLVYEFIRACFYAGAAGQAMAQIFGLLVVEIIALVAFVILKPFEGLRLNAIMVYMLGFSKVSTLALSIAFDTRFNLQRITTTIIGIVIIVIQGILTIVLLIAIVIGAISSYMSVMRNQEEFHPQSWSKQRERYFQHLVNSAPDVPRPPPPPPEEPKEPYFSVKSVTRVAKIEDEDANDYDTKMEAYGSQTSVAGPAKARSRAASVKSTYSVGDLPYGARPHRQSWSSRDFSNSLQETNNRDSALMSRTTTPLHKASNAGSKDNITMQRFGSPFHPNSPQRSGTPQGLSMSARNSSLSPTPRDSVALDDVVKKSQNGKGKERSVGFADETKISESKISGGEQAEVI